MTSHTHGRRARHRDRLTALDAMFLATEDRNPAYYANVGIVLTFGGSPPSDSELAAHLAGRLHRVPRLRQRLVHVAGGIARPVWADDPDFRLDDHLRRRTLPAGATVADATALIESIFTERLDRSRPLWELHILESLPGGQWALAVKLHHAMGDGPANTNIINVLLDTEAKAPPPEPGSWQPQPWPSQASLLAGALSEGVEIMARTIARAGRALGNPGQLRAELSEIGRTLQEIGGAEEVPEAPTNAPFGPRRRMDWVSLSLPAMLETKTRLGVTVNDLFLGLVSGALRAWLAQRDLVPETLTGLRAMVPVALSPRGDVEHMGNRVTMIGVDLPVEVSDAVERVKQVRVRALEAKASRQARGVSMMIGLHSALPAGWLGPVSGVTLTARRTGNLDVTNVRGVEHPLYLLGHRLLSFGSVPLLTPGRSLTIAARSQDGLLGVGFLGDREAIYDLETLADHFAAEAESLGIPVLRRGLLGTDKPRHTSSDVVSALTTSTAR